MEFILWRTYYDKGTNGLLYADGQFVCSSIELPWLNNQHGISCIPEGSYTLLLRYSPKHGEHLEVENVPGRDLILVHPANNALTELKGCIAPVTALTGPGSGALSVKAFYRLMLLAKAALNKKETISITIKKEQYDYP